MTIVFYIIIGIITFLAFLHVLAKKEFNFSRTTVINRPRPTVFAFIRQLKKQVFWFSWFKSTPNITLKYKGEEGNLGSTLYWNGKNIGEGLEKIIKIDEGKVLEFQLLSMKKGIPRTNLYMAVKEIGEGKTKIIMGLRGNYTFPESVLNFLPGRQRIYYQYLEESLQNLKVHLESLDKN